MSTKRRTKNKPVLALLAGAWHLLIQRMGFGNPTAGGFATMKEALLAVAELNKELRETIGIELAVSAHWWHELLVPEDAPGIGYSAKWNNPRAISLEEWADGYRRDIYPEIGRIIPPGFGIDGSDDGAFISPDPERRKLAHNMMVYSFEKAQWVMDNGVGRGHVIYWTGPDGIRWQRLVGGDDPVLSYETVPQLEEYQLIVNGVGNAVREARERGYDKPIVLIEGKMAGDPCYLDAFLDPIICVQGIRDINRIAGAKRNNPAAEWQGELCHERGGGWNFSDAVDFALDQGAMGVSGIRIHFNAGGKAVQNFSRLLEKGTRLSRFQHYVDPDFLPGEGPAEWLRDQRKTLEVVAQASAKLGKPAEVEFDARFCRYADTIGALRKSTLWTVTEFSDAARKLV